MNRIILLAVGMLISLGTSGCTWSYTEAYWNRPERFTVVEEGKVHRFSIVELHRTWVYGFFADASSSDGIVLFEGAAPRNEWDAKWMYTRAPEWRTVWLKDDLGGTSRLIWQLMTVWCHRPAPFQAGLRAMERGVRGNHVIKPSAA